MACLDDRQDDHPPPALVQARAELDVLVVGKEARIEGALADGLRAAAPDAAVTRLASGLPVGADLEYADELTLGRALAGRRAV